MGEVYDILGEDCETLGALGNVLGGDCETLGAFGNVLGELCKTLGGYCKEMGEVCKEMLVLLQLDRRKKDFRGRKTKLDADEKRFRC